MTTTDAGPDLDQPLDGMPPMPPPPPPVESPQPGTGGRGRARPKTTRTRKTAAAGKPAAPAAPRARRPANRPVYRPDYRAGVRTLVESACVPLAIAAMRGDQLAALNMVTLDMHKDGIAESCQQLADMHPAADRVIGYLAQLGPAGTILTGLSAPILQMLTNAGTIPWTVAQRLGCVHPQELLARMTTFDVHADQAADAARPAPTPEPAPDPVI